MRSEALVDVPTVGIHGVVATILDYSSVGFHDAVHPRRCGLAEAAPPSAHHRPVRTVWYSDTEVVIRLSRHASDGLQVDQRHNATLAAHMSVTEGRHGDEGRIP